jgi:hypothetical protein
MENNGTLVAILTRLARAEHHGEPTIATIEAAVPNFRRMDWVNRHSGANGWETVLSAFSTKDIEGLVKCIVIAEREFNWPGGSVAAAIWMYRAYAKRTDADKAALADWVLRNKGRNGYLPFGSSTAARSLEGWRVEQQLRATRRVAHHLKEQEQRVAKLKRIEERAKLAAVRTLERRENSKERQVQISARVGQLRDVDCSTRLSVLASDTSLPLEAIPAALIVECIGAARNLDNKTKQTLLRRIDRRQGRIWKDLRAALISS